ncbi:MAG: fibronectin type III domain-containing protein, partial [Bacteroidota bacterium]
SFDISDDATCFFRKTIQANKNTTRGIDDLISSGGTYPDEMFQQNIMSASGRVSGRNYLRSRMGVPMYNSTVDSTIWVEPGTTDTINVVKGKLGPFRLHHSFNQRTNYTTPRSAYYRDFANDPTRGRGAGITNPAGDRIEDYVNPFLSPVSSGYTTLQGTDVPNVRYHLWSMRMVSDSETLPFDWPGQSTGNYSNTSTDGPHAAINVWQMKGKLSNMVTMNMKWQGERLLFLIQNQAKQVVSSVVILGPGGVITDKVSDYANEWIDFAIRVEPGLVADGDTPGLVLYMRLDTTWVQVVNYSGDLLSEIENYEQYGIPQKYLGTANGGIYPSKRFSDWWLENRWDPFLRLHPGKAYICIDHSGYYYAEYPKLDDPGFTNILTQAAIVFEDVDVTPPADPAAVALVSVDQTSASFSWDANTEPDFSLYRISVTDGQGFNVSDQATTNSYTVTGLTAGQSYTFSVLAEDATGNQSGNATLVFQTDAATRPDAPSQPTISNLTDTGFRVSVTAVANASGYSFRFYDSGGSQISKTNTTNTYLDYSGLTPNTAYSVRAFAYNQYGVSGASPYVYLTTLPAGAQKQAGTVTQIELVEGLGTLRIYPNPFEDRIQIELDLAKSQMVKYELFNELGQRILSDQQMLGQGLQTLRLDEAKTASLSKGLYILNVTVGSQTMPFKLMHP